MGLWDTLSTPQGYITRTARIEEMESLVVVTRHKSHCYHRSKPLNSDRFGSSPKSGSKGINCRSFEPGSGILPTPPLAFNYHESESPRFYSQLPKPSKRSNPISISPRPTSKGLNFGEDCDEFAYSELWAGPTYSNSPPPSSLPIPKFSLHQKRSVSLELPLPTLGIDLAPVSKSAPSSPTGDSVSSATQNLRRILHLDIEDE